MSVGRCRLEGDSRYGEPLFSRLGDVAWGLRGRDISSLNPLSLYDLSPDNVAPGSDGRFHVGPLSRLTWRLQRLQGALIEDSRGGFVGM